MKKNTELNIQSDIVKYLRLNGYFVFSVPNGTYICNPFTRMLWKRAGLMAGVSDLIAITPEHDVIFIEIKTKDGKQLTEQKEFQKEIEKRFYKYYLLRSLDDAIKYFGKKN